MSTPLDTANLTRAEVDALKAKAGRRKRASSNTHANSTCSSCGRRGHRRGVAACPNYDSPARWQPHGKVWERP